MEQLTKEEFEEHLLKAQSFIKNYAIKLCGNEEDALDLLQEVNIKALSNRHLYNHQDKFKSWISSLTYRIFCNLYQERIRHNVNVVDFDSYEFSKCQVFSDDADSNIIYSQLLDEIKQEKDFLILMAFINGYSYLQMSEIFEVPEGTLKSRLFALRKKLVYKLIGKEKIRHNK